MRLRDLGVTVGRLPAGVHNAITDVEGVRVGHQTRIEGDSIRTGVTAIVPHGDKVFVNKVPAAAHTINGYGKACGFEQVRELGCLETPIILTNTLGVGRAADALIGYTLAHNPAARSINPVVGECNDSYLNAIAARPLTADDVLAALSSAGTGAVAEGCVGAGTGTICYGFKGGIGTASRHAGEYTIGALLQTNFGRRDELLINGVPIGYHLAQDAPPRDEDGSVMIIIATDAPLNARQLTRLTHRAAFGLGRTGTVCHHGSGDFVLAFSTAYRQPTTNETRPVMTDEMLNPLFQGVVECVEEAVYNSLVAAETMTGVDGHSVTALPHDAIKRWLTYYRRL